MGAWQLDCASADDRSLGCRSLGTSAGRLGLDRWSLAVNSKLHSWFIEQIDFADKGIDLLDVVVNALI